jgi:hypothetical protein
VADELVQGFRTHSFCERLCFFRGISFGLFGRGEVFCRGKPSSGWLWIFGCRLAVLSWPGSSWCRTFSITEESGERDPLELARLRQRYPWLRTVCASTVYMLVDEMLRDFSLADGTFDLVLSFHASLEPRLAILMD